MNIAWQWIYSNGMFYKQHQPNTPWDERMQAQLNVDGQFAVEHKPPSGLPLFYISFRLEGRLRGNAYWSAYKRINGRLVKRYVGKKYELNEQKIKDTAQEIIDLWNAA